MTKEDIIKQQNAYYMAGHPSRHSENEVPSVAPTLDAMCEMLKTIDALRERNETLNAQLTKAKEILKTCLGFMQAFGYSPSIDKLVTEAEQFLKEVGLTEEQKSTLKYYDKIFIKE